MDGWTFDTERFDTECGQSAESFEREYKRIETGEKITSFDGYLAAYRQFECLVELYSTYSHSDLSREERKMVVRWAIHWLQGFTYDMEDYFSRLRERCRHIDSVIEKSRISAVARRACETYWENQPTVLDLNALPIDREASHSLWERIKHPFACFEVTLEDLQREFTAACQNFDRQFAPEQLLFLSEVFGSDRGPYIPPASFEEEVVSSIHKTRAIGACFLGLLAGASLAPKLSSPPPPEQMAAPTHTPAASLAAFLKSPPQPITDTFYIHLIGDAFAKDTRLEGANPLQILQSLHHTTTQRFHSLPAHMRSSHELMLKQMEQAIELTQALRSLNSHEFAKLFRERYEALAPGESLGFSCGYTNQQSGHHIFYSFEKQADGLATVNFFNLGDGA
ncbi:MAG: hypothetical protein KDK40_03470, partial [Chlamydiia bacterium]|nr:hypothetical protein [Chlamydiia bacterium]